MRDWNVVVTTREGRYNQAVKLLDRFGMVDKTDYFNVLLMRVIEPIAFMDALREEAEKSPDEVSSLARVIPVMLAFTFQSPSEFEEKAQQAVSSFLPDLGGKTFHLRMHRRGFKGKLSGWDEERFLDTFLLDSLEAAGTEGKITFEDPDAIIVLDTVGQWAGLSLWTREQLQHYPLLHLD